MSYGNQKHILVAVLDWGLGHATRCIPIINCLIANQSNVSIAGNGPSLELLKQEFPQLSFHEFPSYRITYPSHRFFFLHLLFQLPHILKVIRNEHIEVERLLRINQFDVIISDNRYGCYSSNVHSVFVTHQLNMPIPTTIAWSKWVINRIIYRLIKKFNTCWVPDFPDSRLTGELTATKRLKVRFIGILSRFIPSLPVEENEFIVGLVSGPEPQREIFEKLLIREFKKLNRPCLIVRGLPNLDQKETIDKNVTLINHASSNDLQRLISKAGIIVSRSGYSTIMDLQILGKKNVIVVPTPGQTEQEYLAFELDKKKIALAQPQDRLDVKGAIEKSKEYSGFDASEHQTNLLNEAIQDLLHQI